MSCLRCGRCCKTNPCDVSQRLYLKIKNEFPELRMEKNKSYLGCMSPKTTYKRKNRISLYRKICIYYEETDGIANCKLAEKSKLFKKIMMDGSITFACQRSN